MGKTRDMSNLLNSTPADVDATSLDGASGEQYVRSDQADTTSSLTVQGDLTVSGTVSGALDYGSLTNLPDPTVTLTGFASGTGTMTDLGNVSITTARTIAPTLSFNGDVTGASTITSDNAAFTLSYNLNTMKSAIQTFDGPGSGIDSDLLDSQQGTYYLDYGNFSNTTALMNQVRANDGSGSNLDADKLDGQEGTYYTTYGNITGTPTSITDLDVTDGQSGQYLVTDGNGGFTFQYLVIEGAADAATLDGLDSLQFLRSDVDTTSTATITANAFSGPLTGNVTGDLAGNVTGDLTGNVTGNVTGAVTGNVTGDLTGNVTGDLTGNVTGDLTGDVTGDLTGDVTGDVTGNLTGDVTATTVDVTAHIDLNNTSNPSYSEGRIFYDNDNGALAVYNDESDITLQVGQEEYVKVKNNTGVTITNGSAVYLSGEDATVPTIVKATAATEVGSYAVGLATHDIETGTTGYVTTRGLVQGIDTSSLTAGERVHVGVTAGTIQTAAPTYPYFTTDIGICLVSNASTGCIYVDVQAHVFEVIRVTGNSHMDGNLTVDGNFTVNGTQTITSTTNIALSGSQQFLNSGDTILAATHTGTGLDDAVFRGHFTGTTSTTYYIKIDSVGGGTNGVDTFAVSTDNFTTTISSNNDLTDDAQLIHSADNISVEFNATTGHTLNDVWSGTAAPVDVDTGLWSNRNTGSTGIGYTNLGFYFDVSDTKWKLVDEYDPTPGNNIDVTDSSFSLGILEAGGFEGPLTGAVTGNVTGNLTGNVTAGTITTTGSVGIGTSSPSSLIHGSGLNAELRLQHTGNSYYQRIFTDSSNNLKFGTGANGTERMRIDSSGNVGIGTSSPVSIGGHTGVLTLYGSNATGLVLKDAVGQKDIRLDNGDLKITDSGGSPHLAVTSAGLVGIGTSSPDATLQVVASSTNSEYARFSSTDSRHLRFSSFDTASTDAGHDINASSSNGVVTISTGGTERMRIDSAGLVGIGTTSPATYGVDNADDLVIGQGDGHHGITISSYGTSNGTLAFSDQTGATVGRGFVNYDHNVNAMSFGTLSTERLRIDSSGNVGIGNTSPSEKLHVTGNILASGDVTAFSDERLKDNIETLDGSKVYEMRGVSFTKDGEASSGVIAQELQKVAPELVNENGEYLSVAYGNVVGYLIEAIKDLKSEIEELKKD
jgi:hypothetical protein